jgi:hypothetical protein
VESIVNKVMILRIPWKVGSALSYLRTSPSFEVRETMKGKLKGKGNLESGRRGS